MTTKINTPKEQGKAIITPNKLGRFKTLEDHFIYGVNRKTTSIIMSNEEGTGNTNIALRQIEVPNEITGRSNIGENEFNIEDYYEKKLKVVMENIDFDAGTYHGMVKEITITGEYTKEDYSKAMKKIADNGKEYAKKNPITK